MKKFQFSNGKKPKLIFSSNEAPPQSVWGNLMLSMIRFSQLNLFIKYIERTGYDIDVIDNQTLEMEWYRFLCKAL